MQDSIYINDLNYVVGDENYRVNQYITVYNPTIEEIRLFGEDLYNYVLSLFARRPYDIAIELDDLHIDYQSIDEYDLFVQSASSIPIEYSCILFGKVDFTRFELWYVKETGEKILVSKDDHNFKIDRVIYLHMLRCLRKINFLSEKVEYDMGNAAGKRFLLERMRRKRKKYLRDIELGKIKKTSNIATMIIFCVNNSNFKYNYESVQKIKISMLYSSFYFISHKEERSEVISGVYFGTVDTKKMKDKDILLRIPDLHK